MLICRTICLLQINLPNILFISYFNFAGHSPSLEHNFILININNINKLPNILLNLNCVYYLCKFCAKNINMRWGRKGRDLCFKIF